MNVEGHKQGMAKLRVYQLARELNRDNAEIIRELQHMGVPVTSHSNTVEDRLADRLRRNWVYLFPRPAKRGHLRTSTTSSLWIFRTKRFPRLSRPPQPSNRSP